jgi:UPF0113 PUA domain
VFFSLIQALGNAQPRMGPKGARGHGFPLGDSGEDCVWANPNGEMSFLYGNHIVNAHLERMLMGIPEDQEVWRIWSDRTVDRGYSKITARSFWCSVKCILSVSPSI